MLKRNKVAILVLVFVLSLSFVFAEAATGRVLGKVLSSNGDMLVSGIIIEDSNGNRWRETTNNYGGYVLNLSPGTYKLVFDKGNEFSQYSTSITVESYKTYYLKDVRLQQLYDSYAEGWIAGDLHQHTIYSDGLDTVDQLITANASVGLYFGFLTDHDSSRGVPEWRESTGSVVVFTEADGTKRTFTGFAGVEVTSTFGHYQSLGTGMTFEKYEINLTESELANSKSKEFAREKAIYIAKQVKRAGGVPQINHPYSSTNMGAMNFMAADDWDFLSNFDSIEVWNGYFIVPDGRFTSKTSENQNYTSKLLWYGTLNHIKDGGKYIVAVGGTDDHDSTGYASSSATVKFNADMSNISNYYNLCRYERKYAGTPTTYVYLGSNEITQDNVLASILDGHCFVSNGPVVICTVDGAIYGETVKAKNGSVTINSDIFARDGIKQIRIVKNGETVKEIELNMQTEYKEDIVVSGLESGDWFIIEVLGDYNDYAFTNPFFVK